MDEQKRLYRRPDQAMIGGVATGFADYFNLDVSVMRIIFVVFTLATSGLGIILYIILLVILPTQGQDASSKDSQSARQSSKASSGQLRDYFGVALVLVGLWLLIGQLFPGWLVLRWDLVWPAVLIALGLLITVKAK